MRTIEKHFGITRVVILVGPYAIKLPQWNYGWDKFLHGLLANMQEVVWGRGYDDRLCPVVWWIPGGWMTVMQRVDHVLTNENEIDYSVFQDGIPSGDDKPDNYGMLNGRIVKIDYGG
jgi:hypothetical protein